MTAPLPNLFKVEHRGTKNIQPYIQNLGTEEPELSDYLVPLPSVRNTNECYSSEGAGATFGGSITVCTPPLTTSPTTSAQNVNENSITCWETSFIMSNSKSDQPLISSTEHSPVGVSCIDDIKTNQCCSHQRRFSINELQAITSCKECCTNNAKVTGNYEDTKLISLDTPQPTPTAVRPPMSFSSQLDGITLHASELKVDRHILAVSNQSYANIQVFNPTTLKNCTEKISKKSIGNSSSNTTITNNINRSITTNKSISVPFTVQGFTNNFLKKDSHSEISC